MAALVNRRLIFSITASLLLVGLLFEWQSAHFLPLSAQKLGLAALQPGRVTQAESIDQNSNGSRPKVILPVDDNAYEFLYDEKFESALDRAEKSPKKTILFWHPNGDNSMTFSDDLGRECGGCLVRQNKKLIDDEKTEAVIILFDYTVPGIRPTVKRNPNQYWIWRCAEAPPYMKRGRWLTIADEIGFNLTLTYRLDSDVHLNYGNAVQETGTKLDNVLEKKENLAFTAISNCDMTPVAVVRLKYVKELIKKGLRIDTIGRCFGHSPITRLDEKKMLEHTSKYKFYFAFENSYHCKDYITEKFFRAIHAGVVPVVWGATKEMYEYYVPSTAFIFVEDFPSMQHLIDYLNYLDKNDTAYLEYFRWRSERDHHPHYKRKTGVCEICRFLHGIQVDDAYNVAYDDLNKSQPFIIERPPRKIVPSIRKWWDEHDNEDCYKKDLRLDDNGRIVAA